VKKTLQKVHEAFIQNVQQGRGNRLKDDPDLFTGRFWCGEEALELGLIDGYGDAHFVAREVVKAETLVDYSPSTNLLDRLANRIGATTARALTELRLH
jgi:protease IV